MCENNIKSKQRVVEYGEVYTPEHIVKEMLDLVKDELNRIDSTFFEPACGNGNFLVEILARKLELAKSLGDGSYELNVFKSVATIYAVDILSDNIEEAKERMVNLIKQKYAEVTRSEPRDKLMKAIMFAIDTNILWGNTLTGRTGDDKNPLMVSEWRFIGEQVERNEYVFSQLNSPLVGNIPEYEYEAVHFLDVDKAGKKNLGKLAI